MKGLGNVMYKLLASVSWVHKNQCMSECVCECVCVRTYGLAQRSHVAL